MPRERLLVMALGLALVLAFAGAAGAGPQGFAPYTGVIQNCTGQSISIPSANSDGVLIVPPGGWTEYVAWKPDFQLIGYVDGQPYYCQRVAVMPKNFQFKCTYYDFVTLIQGPNAPAQPCPGKKTKPGKDVIWGGEVEGYG